MFPCAPCILCVMHHVRGSDHHRQLPPLRHMYHCKCLFPACLSCLVQGRLALPACQPRHACRISTGTSQHYARSQAGPALLRAARIYSWFHPAIYRAPGSSLRCHDGLFNHKSAVFGDRSKSKSRN
jgi:hypothetical protein